MKTIKKYWRLFLLTTLCILLTIMPAAPALAALTKTTTIDQIDAWQAVTGGTLVVGTADSISDSYATVLYIEVAIIEAVAQDGAVVIVEISYGNDDWVQLTTFAGTAETPATTTLNDAAADAGDTSITLTDATTGDFDIPARKWFIKDGTIGNSESVKTVVNATHTVTLCQDLMRNHANGLSVYDRVDEWAISIPVAASYVRVLINNTDADCDVAFTTRISKMTGI